MNEAAGDAHRGDAGMRGTARGTNVVIFETAAGPEVVRDAALGACWCRRSGASGARGDAPRCVDGAGGRRRRCAGACRGVTRCALRRCAVSRSGARARRGAADGGGERRVGRRRCATSRDGAPRRAAAASGTTGRMPEAAAAYGKAARGGAARRSRRGALSAAKALARAALGEAIALLDAVADARPSSRRRGARSSMRRGCGCGAMRTGSRARWRLERVVRGIGSQARVARAASAA